MFVDLVYFINIVFSVFTGAYLLIKLRPANNSNHITFLALYFICNAFCFSFYLLIKYDIIISIPYLYKIAAPITYLIAPFSFLHLKTIIKNKPSISRRDMLHFVLFFIFLVSYFEFYFMPIDEKTAYVIKVSNNFKLTYQDNIGLIPEFINTIGRILHPFVYLILQWHMLLSSKAKKLKTKDFKLYNWLYKLTLFQSIYTLSLLATIMLNIVFETANVNQFLELIPTILTITFFFTISGYLLWHQDLLRRLKYVNLSPLSQDLSNITKRVKLEKYFKDPHINLEKLSDLLTINSKDLSQLIRQDYSNFNKWINSLRIEYSLELLKQGYLNQYSVEALSEAAGFKSKNTFYRAFKEITNTTPIKYMKDNSEPLHAT